jgi:Tol biopolymer transport system component
VHEILWLPTGQGLLALYRRKGPSYQRFQIGIIPRTGGQIQPVTRDTNGYSALTLSADGKTAATVQLRVNRSLSLLPGSGKQGNAAIQTLSAQDVDSATWSADGKLLVSDAQGVRA